MGEVILVGARFLQFAGVLVVFGSPLYFLYATRPSPTVPTRPEQWQRLLVLAAAGCALTGTLVWILVETALVGDGWQDAIHPATVWTLVSETRFGRAALARAALLAVALLLCLVPLRPRTLWLSAATLGTAATATFAWTGHGAMDRDAVGLIHLGADLLHLLCAGLWLGALFPLAILAWRSHGSPSVASASDTVFGLMRFSRIGLAVVALLTLSGFVNSWFLIGPTQWTALLTNSYGLTLTVKIALFGLMLILAARNRYRHTPALQKLISANGEGVFTLRALRTTLWSESLLALAVLLAVGILGTLAPPIALD
jgi:putative copper resistance protein D